jgi:hypothetical protein
MADKETEKDIQTAILHALAAIPGIRAWRSNTGVARPFGKEYGVKFGVNGQADISGLVWGSGRRLEIECKTPIGRLSQRQIWFREMIIGAGGVHIVARSVDDVIRGLTAAGVEIPPSVIGGAA